MKSKKATWFLIVAVIAVWGVIIYRLLIAAGSDEKLFIRTVQPKVAYESLEGYLLEDTFKLVLNYRDPFLEKEVAVNEIPADLTIKTAPALQNNTALNKPASNLDIKYTGYIKNSSGKRIVAIVTINGKEYMISEGETVAGVKLIKNHRDSVRVSYEGKTKFVKLQ